MGSNEKTKGKIADQSGRKPPRKWMKIEPIRLIGQAVLIILLNFTVIGSIYFSPFFPILRLDIPFSSEIPNIYEHGQIRACPMATFQRTLTDTWDIMLLIFALSMFLLVVVMIGRALCGWACPFGLIQDLFSRIRNWLNIPAKEFKQKTHERLSMLRFMILGFSLFLSISIGISVMGNNVAGNVFKSYLPTGTCQTAPYCGVCPTPSLFYVLRVITFQEKLALSEPIHILMWVMLGIFVVGSFLQPRFFCRYICPTGAMSSPFNKISLLHLHKEIDKCTKCHVCHTNCPTRVREVLDEDRKERLGDVGCIFCGECVQRCPERILTFKFGPFTIYRGGTTWHDRLSFMRRKGPKNT